MTLVGLVPTIVGNIYPRTSAIEMNLSVLHMSVIISTGRRIFIPFKNQIGHSTSLPENFQFKLKNCPEARGDGSLNLCIIQRLVHMISSRLYPGPFLYCGSLQIFYCCSISHVQKHLQLIINICQRGQFYNRSKSVPLSFSTQNISKIRRAAGNQMNDTKFLNASDIVQMCKLKQQWSTRLTM